MPVSHSVMINNVCSADVVSLMAGRTDLGTPTVNTSAISMQPSRGHLSQCESMLVSTHNMFSQPPVNNGYVSNLYGDTVTLSSNQTASFIYNDQITPPTCPSVISNTSSDYSLESSRTLTSQTPTIGQEIRLIIIEQPMQRGFRFRYKSELGSHGGLQGEKSCKQRRTYPRVKIEGYQGPAKIEVSLVTDSETPLPHVHQLVWKNKSDHGSVPIYTSPDHNMEATFHGLGILHVPKKEVPQILKCNLEKQYESEMSSSGYTKADIQQKAKETSQKEAKHIALNAVRLKFVATPLDERNTPLQILKPVFSNGIYDSKAPGAGILKICRMSKSTSLCTGDEEIFLLCEKVQREDIEIRFYEENADGDPIWEEKGIFNTADVHKQFAIVFKTPPYHDLHIRDNRTVYIQLKRNKDGALSAPREFTYKPAHFDRDEIEQKKGKSLDLLPLVTGRSNSPLPADLSTTDPMHLNPTIQMSGDHMVGHLCRSVGQVELTDIQRRKAMLIDGEREVSATYFQSAIESSTYTGHCQNEMCLMLESFLKDVSVSGANSSDMFGSFVDKYDSSGYTMLHMAVLHQHTRAIIYFIMSLSKIDDSLAASIINCKKKCGESPLHLALSALYMDIASLLIRAGAKCDEPNDSGYMPLHLAAKAALGDVVSLMLTCNQSLSCINKADRTGFTPLQLAVNSKSAVCVKSLLQHPSHCDTIDVNIQHSVTGKTALHMAVETKQEECVQLLLNADANIDVTTNNGFTALHVARDIGYDKITRLLEAEEHYTYK